MRTYKFLDINLTHVIGTWINLIFSEDALLLEQEIEKGLRGEPKKLSRNRRVVGGMEDMSIYDLPYMVSLYIVR